MSSCSGECKIKRYEYRDVKFESRDPMQVEDDDNATEAERKELEAVLAFTDAKSRTQLTKALTGPQDLVVEGSESENCVCVALADQNVSPTEWHPVEVEVKFADEVYVPDARKVSVLIKGTAMQRSTTLAGECNRKVVKLALAAILSAIDRDFRISVGGGRPVTIGDLEDILEGMTERTGVAAV